MSGPELVPGRILAGRYRLERCLGEGGMGMVWAAGHTVTRRAVAMKLLKASLLHKPEIRQRFLREAQAASALRHPNVVEVLDVFDLEDGSPVMVMELLEGETLAAKLERDERLSAEETAAIMLPVIAAVGSAHALGIVHRDMKPENIFLSAGPEGTVVKVLDFGIAKLSAEHYLQGQSVLVTEAGSFLGTPCYMAPEQINNVSVDHRADIWSIGVILYECLSGMRPIEGQNMPEVISRLLNDAITPLERLAPELPHELSAIVQRTLSRDPKRRPEDLGELSKVLRHYSHVSAPTFGPPRAHQSIDESAQVSADGPTVASQPQRAGRSLDGAIAKPETRGATLQSAPAVGFDGSQNRTKEPVERKRSRAAYFIAAASVIALPLLFTLGRDKQEPNGDSKSPSMAGALVSPLGDVTRSQPVPAPAPLERSAKEPPNEAKTVPEELNTEPSSVKTKDAAPKKAKPRRTWTSQKPAPNLPPRTQAPTEESLFSGRK